MIKNTFLSIIAKIMVKLWGLVNFISKILKYPVTQKSKMVVECKT